MMQVVLYSAGYQRLDQSAFVAFVQRENLVVADLRLKPVSRNFEWNKNAMATLLGDHYVWIEELGNLNYRGGPIVLKDEAMGLAKLWALLRRQSVVVLCVCADPAICHRTVVTKKLEAEGVMVLPLPTLVPTTTPALF